MIKFEQNLEEIRKDHKSIFNRLKSIEEDALFIDQVATLYPHLPLTANERCGSWYINLTKHKVHSVYFKSTDGHTGEWDFNVRRGNFSWLETIAAHQGAIVVDSTRRGKRIPDALSKTIPIWCCVINRAVHQYNNKTKQQQQQQQTASTDWDTRFHSLPSAVFRSEHAQIELKIDGFVQKLWDLGVDIERLAGLVKKPLRPLWLTPQSSLDQSIDTSEFYPVICVSASEFIENGGCQARPSGYLYVQGSADDQEAWSMGLTCGLFWKHHKDILQQANTCEQKVQTLVREYQQDRKGAGNDENAVAHIIKGSSIVIGNRGAAAAATAESYDAIIQCCTMKDQARPHRLDLAIPEGKKGQHVLEKAISLAIDFARPYLAQNKSVLVFSIDGKDRAVGIALALFVHFYNDKGQFTNELDQVITKESIRQKLIQLIASHPQAAPSRVTLRRVNTHFLSASATLD